MRWQSLIPQPCLFPHPPPLPPSQHSDVGTCSAQAASEGGLSPPPFPLSLPFPLSPHTSPPQLPPSCPQIPVTVASSPSSATGKQLQNQFEYNSCSSSVKCSSIEQSFFLHNIYKKGLIKSQLDKVVFVRGQISKV